MTCIEFFKNSNMHSIDQFLFNEKINIDDDIKKLTDDELQYILKQIQISLNNSSVQSAVEKKKINENLIKIFNQLDKEVILRRLDNSVKITIKSGNRKTKHCIIT